jgi:GTP-binding protein HflX
LGALSEIHGNTSGLAPSQLKALERIYRRKVPFDRLLTPELTRSMADVSHSTGRQVGVLVDRRGEVDFVIVGDAHKLWLPDFGRLRAAEGRFRGLRLIHTHLNLEGLTRDDLVDLTRLRLDLVAAICLGPDGRAIHVHYGHNVPVAEGSKDAPYETHGPIPYGKLDVNPAELVTALEAEFAQQRRGRRTQAKDGRAMLVHVSDKRHAALAEDSLRELEELARTAGVDVADTVLQVRERVDPKFVLGRGKVDEVVLRAMQLDVEVLVFDRNLTPAQAANIAGVTDLKVLDRTQLILDIFAQRAESRDGKLQVELAQMKYLLPRLGQQDGGLSRLTGGIGGRGPGETKLEIGRRRARDRITRLERELKRLGKQRKQRRSRRKRRGVPIVSIVGYTNAGKSTLLNTLTDSEVLAEDKLFATLDTRSRRIRFPREREVIITDTVGFIRDLPKDLFAAFRATFEEAQDADLLLHVVDGSDAAASDHIRTTDALLGELGLAHVPRLLVLNKMDRLPPASARGLVRSRGGIGISALDRDTLRPLLVAIEARLFPDGGGDLLGEDGADVEADEADLQADETDVEAGATGYAGDPILA